MGYHKFLPCPDERMGALLAVSNINNAAILELGPMGTANYSGLTAASLGLPPNRLHFAAHTTDIDLSLGEYPQLAEALRDIESRYRPELIFVFSSALLSVIGADIDNIMRDAAGKIATPVVYYSPRGLDRHFMYGIEGIISRLVPFVQPAPAKKARSYNILGLLPDDFHFQSDSHEIKRMLGRYFDAECSSTFPYDTNLLEIQKLGQAELNIVIRRECLSFAKTLARETGTPYVYMRPYGIGQNRRWLDDISRVTGWAFDEELARADFDHVSEIIDRWLAERSRAHGPGREKEALVAGLYDTAKGVSLFLQGELGYRVTAWCKASFERDVQALREPEWETLASRPIPVMLSDAEACSLNPYGGHIISHPSLNRRDLTGLRPYVGINGCLSLLQAVDDCIQKSLYCSSPV